MRLLPALVLSASLALGACQHPDGRTDWGSTLALGGGIAAITGIALMAANSSDERRHQREWRRYGGYERSGYRARRSYDGAYARAYYPQGW